MRADIWRPQIEELSKTHHVAWFDNRGIAQSESGTQSSPTMKDFAADATLVLNALGWNENVHLVGVSMGGMIAQELALLEPHRFSTLTLIATHAGGSILVKVPPQRAVRFLGSFWMPKRFRVRSIRGILYPPKYLKTMDQVALDRRIELQLGRPAPKSIMLKQIRAVLGFNVRDQLGTLSLPTLVVRPGLDILVSPRHSDELLTLLPNARMIEFPDAGHGVIFQCSARLNEAIAEHIQDHG